VCLVVGVSSLPLLKSRFKNPLLLNVLGSITIGDYLETKKEKEKGYEPFKV
jgi:hypothetical protein